MIFNFLKEYCNELIKMSIYFEFIEEKIHYEEKN
mgnify:CR=1 FL=1|jgi:hypothetical protein